jgi:hypothetical protein
VDLVSDWCGPDDLPLQPIVRACGQLQEVWKDFYRKGCDDLLESLINQWHQLQDPQSEIRNPQSAIRSLSPIRNPQSEIRNRKSGSS